MKLPTRDRLHDVFAYEAETGILRFKCKLANRTKIGAEAGSPTRKGCSIYKRVTVDGVRFYAHQAVWIMHHGDIPDGRGVVIDHIDGDGSNNRLCNLRLTDQSGNARNTKRRVDNATGVMGVSMCSTTGRWKARLANEWLGRFDSFGDAVQARRDAEARSGFSSRHGVAVDRPVLAKRPKSLGVVWSGRYGKWQAERTINGKRLYAGRFACFGAAVRAAQSLVGQ